MILFCIVLRLISFSDFHDFYSKIDSIFQFREAINFHDIAFWEFFALVKLNGLNELLCWADVKSERAHKWMDDCVTGMAISIHKANQKTFTSFFLPMSLMTQLSFNYVFVAVWNLNLQFNRLGNRRAKINADFLFLPQSLKLELISLFSINLFCIIPHNTQSIKQKSLAKSRIISVNTKLFSFLRGKFSNSAKTPEMNINQL